MISAKQRSYLKKLANPMKPMVHIGKEGVNDRVIAQLNEILDAHELVKISILETASLDARDTAVEVCRICRAEFVQAIGGRFTIYRKNHENSKIDLSQMGIRNEKNHLSNSQLSETGKKIMARKKDNDRVAAKKSGKGAWASVKPFSKGRSASKKGQ
jgi:RNA-binding protein